MIDLEPSLIWANTHNFNNDNINDNVTYIDRNSEHLIIVAGDSWTYGDSLNSDQRIEQMYGNLVSKKLDADLVNIGFRGWSNSWVLTYVKWLLQNQKKQVSNYKKVTLICTLTENARDVKTYHSFQFNYINAYKTHGACKELYQTILESAENHWCDLLDQIRSFNFINQVLITTNFVWHNTEKLQQTDKNWIEVIADQAGYDNPIRTNMVTGWVFDSLATINDIAGIKDLDAYKNFVLPYIEKANQVNAWLCASEYNGKKASKHPDWRAHKFWADYLIDYIEK